MRGAVVCNRKSFMKSSADTWEGEESPPFTSYFCSLPSPVLQSVLFYKQSLIIYSLLCWCRGYKWGKFMALPQSTPINWQGKIGKRLVIWKWYFSRERENIAVKVKCRYSAYRNASKKVIWTKLASMLKEMAQNEEGLEPVARKQMQ